MSNGNTPKQILTVSGFKLIFSFATNLKRTNILPIMLVSASERMHFVCVLLKQGGVDCHLAELYSLH